jgi:chromosome segregation ATPase
MTTPKKHVDPEQRVEQLLATLITRDEKILDLETANDNYKENLQDARDHVAVLRRQIAAVDGILDEIMRASMGIEPNGRHGFEYAYEFNSVRAESDRIPERDERQENRISELHARIETLQMRRAAVEAIARFAKEHKA